MLAQAFYDAFVRLALPAVLLRARWRARREPLYGHALGERLGRYTAPPESGRLWVHAVSLGETRAAEPLIAELRRQRPGLRLLLTHGTATGREAGAKLLQPGDAQAWLPWDTPGATRRFLRAHRPVAGVVLETEVWPNLMAACREAGLPVVLANARLSARSLRKGERLRALMAPAVAAFTRVLAQTEDDAARLRTMGAREPAVMGNLKYDLTPDPALVERGRAWRDGAGRPVVLAASTREGEEAPLLAAWRALPAPRPLLLLVPRHPQRFDEVFSFVQQAGFAVQRRSAWGDTPPAGAGAADVWLGDSLREMPLYYGAAHAALLGGSFAPLGGQNLIEAAACGCPLVMGPHTFNFADAAELSLAAGASVRVASVDDGVPRAAALAVAPDREAWVQRAQAFTAAHRGAAARMATAVLALLR